MIVSNVSLGIRSFALFFLLALPLLATAAVVALGPVLQGRLAYCRTSARLGEGTDGEPVVRELLAPLLRSFQPFFRREYPLIPGTGATDVSLLGTPGCVTLAEALLRSRSHPHTAV